MSKINNTTKQITEKLSMTDQCWKRQRHTIKDHKKEFSNKILSVDKTIQIKHWKNKYISQL